ncbi:MAG: patatin-like phospholipase family protein [Planctomycetota bacterium]
MASLTQASPSTNGSQPRRNFQGFGPFHDQRRTVLVLGGGAMRGMAHIGVLRALEKLGVRYDAIVGTSIGAVVGTFAAAGVPLEEMERLVGSLNKGDYFRLNFLKFLFKGVRTPSVYRGDTFRRTLAEILPVERFDDLRVPFYCNAVCLQSGGQVFWGAPGLDELPLVDAVYSSCCLPGIFEPFERDGLHYIDGGMVDPLPLRFAKLLGADTVIAVDLTVKASFKQPNYKDRVLSTMYRTFEVVQEHVAEDSLHMHANENTILIQPKVSHLERFDFTSVDDVVRLGYDETIRVLTSHAKSRNSLVVTPEDRMSCPVHPRDYVSIRIDPEACIGCGMCEMVCETDAFAAGRGSAEVRKVHNYECTRDHACERNCPTNAIRLGNL